MLLLMLITVRAGAQTCPAASSNTVLTSFPNSYFAGGFGFLGADVTYPIGTTTVAVQGSTTGYQGAGANAGL